MQNKVLVVDDDPKLTALLDSYLTSHNYLVAICHDGHSMFKSIKFFEPDLIILDIMLPGDDGLVLCKKIRQISSTPILMLTARGNDIDRIIGLETGADDYLAKPFSPRELVARMKSILRRFSEQLTLPSTARTEHTKKHNLNNNVKFDSWTLDLGSYHLIDDNGVVTILSTGEFKLLRLFTEHANKVLTRDQLMDVLAGHDADPTDRTVDVMISRLRRRLNDNAKAPNLIITVRNEGYKLNCDTQSS
nr:response regulator transcription factor [uncultured Tolumonas sp.]